MEVEDFDSVEQIGSRRVCNGAEWLDAVHPGWEHKIDLSTLDIGDGCFCICGQLMGGFYDVAEMTDRVLGSQGRHWLYNHGFIDDLDTEAWVELIKGRFDMGITSDVMDGFDMKVEVVQ